MRGRRPAAMTRRIILNADDFGYDPAVTRGIARSMREGVVSSTTMIVNSPFSAEAARQAMGLSIGLHLNLVRFEAISTGQALVEGQVSTLSADFVEHETDAQLARLQTLLGREATHLDVHKHAHQQPAVLEGLVRSARRHGLAVRSISEAMRAALRLAGVATNDVFVGEAGASAYWSLETFRARLDELPRSGVIELMCHPGYSPSDIPSGYAAQREVELATFTSAEARAELSAREVAFEPWGPG
jgi:chitin disaccharide deacetylase